MSDGEVLGFPHGHGREVPEGAYLTTESMEKFQEQRAANPAPMRVYHSKPDQSPAAKILQTASDLIDGERDEQHGNRLECHNTIAALWGVYLGCKIEARDVAMLMALLKIARVKTGGYNGDCFVDGAGYLALAGELTEAK